MYITPVSSASRGANPTNCESYQLEFGPLSRLLMCCLFPKPLHNIWVSRPYFEEHMPRYTTIILALRNDFCISYYSCSLVLRSAIRISCPSGAYLTNNELGHLGRLWSWDISKNKKIKMTAFYRVVVCVQIWLYFLS